MSAEPRFPGEDDARAQRHLRVVPSAPDEAKQAKQKKKSRRALVPQAVRSNGRGTIVLAFLLIPVALIFILFLNILVAGRQYDLVNMRATEKTLTQQNEAIAQEIEFYQAPQDLSTRASQLGLVASTFSASLNLQTGELSGTPVAATKAEDTAQDPNAVTIAPPALYDTKAFATASKRAEEAKAKKDAEAKAKAEEDKKKATSSASPEAQKSAEPSPSHSE